MELEQRFNLLRSFVLRISLLLSVLCKLVWWLDLYADLTENWSLNFIFPLPNITVPLGIKHHTMFDVPNPIFRFSRGFVKFEGWSFLAITFVTIIQRIIFSKVAQAFGLKGRWYWPFFFNPKDFSFLITTFSLIITFRLEFNALGWNLNAHLNKQIFRS